MADLLLVVLMFGCFALAAAFVGGIARLEEDRS